MKLPTFQNPLKLFEPAFAGAGQGFSGMNGGHMMFASSGSGSGSGGGYDDDDDYGFDEAPDDDESIEETPRRRPQSNRTRRSAGKPNAVGGRSRTAGVQPEERYWTDYLRIALPVIGIILMLGLLWVWASSLLGDSDTGVDEPDEDTIGLVTTQTPDPNEINTEPDSASTPAVAPGGQTNAGEIPIPGQTDPQPTNVPFNPTATEPVAAGDNQAGGEDEEPADTGTGEIAVDARVRITEDNVNVRSSAGTSGEAQRVASAGEEAVVASGPEEADGYVWWQVVFDTGEGGYVVEDFLELVP